VALSVLVYQKTHSTLLTAAVYALTFIPGLVGSFLLGPLADHFPRRTLLVVGDLLRAVLLGLMALLGHPIFVLTILIVFVVVIESPWRATQTALVGDILAGQGYVLGQGLRFAGSQGAQLVGFAVGGAAVALTGARWALALDALTFIVSALFIRFGVRERPAPDWRPDERDSHRPSWLAGVQFVLASKKLRALLGLSWLAGLFVVPEGLAAPYAASLGGGPKTIGILLAALPAGTLIGTLALSRFVSTARRTALVGPLAVLAGLPLAACALKPGLAMTLLLWTLTGACTSYLIQIITEFAEAVPNHMRGQALGVLTSGMIAMQGVGLLAAGLLAQAFTITTTIAICGFAAVVFASPLALGRRIYGAHSVHSPTRKPEQTAAW
jgi:MFS family permease